MKDLEGRGLSRERVPRKEKKKCDQSIPRLKGQEPWVLTLHSHLLRVSLGSLLLQ